MKHEEIQNDLRSKDPVVFRRNYSVVLEIYAYPTVVVCLCDMHRGDGCTYEATG